MMKYKNIIFCISLILLLCCCSKNNGKEKRFDVQENRIDIKEKIVKIDMDDSVEISRLGIPYILNEFLIISDYNAPHKLIHIYNKHTFKYLKSIGERGEGPAEITNMGEIESNEKERIFYVIDHGKQKILEYAIDSVLSDSCYVPKQKAAMHKMEFPVSFQYVNDTLSYALFFKVLNSNDYKPVASRWNMQTGEVVYMNYEGHPQIKQKRVEYAVSPKYGLYVEVYWYNELISLGSLNDSLKFNLYGKNWDDKNVNHIFYFRKAAFCKDKIVVSYSGDKHIINESGIPKVHYPKQLVLFNLEGDYLATLIIEYPIISFAYDTDNNRIIFAFDDEMQFGYLDMDGII